MLRKEQTFEYANGAEWPLPLSLSLLLCFFFCPCSDIYFDMKILSQSSSFVITSTKYQALRLSCGQRTCPFLFIGLHGHHGCSMTSSGCKSAKDGGAEGALLDRSTFTYTDRTLNLYDGVLLSIFWSMSSPCTFDDDGDGHEKLTSA